MRYRPPTWVIRGHPDLTRGPYYLLVPIRNALYSPIQWEAVTNSKLLVFVSSKDAMNLVNLLPRKMVSKWRVAGWCHLQSLDKLRNFSAWYQLNFVWGKLLFIVLVIKNTG